MRFSLATDTFVIYGQKDKYLNKLENIIEYRFLSIWAKHNRFVKYNNTTKYVYFI
jgi:hypothetical protein